VAKFQENITHLTTKANENKQIQKKATIFQHEYDEFNQAHYKT
jgi:hypothetical protein